MPLWCMQISAGQKLTGRTCATALPACERQGVIWVYPAPGAAPSQDAIPSQLACLHCQQVMLLCIANFKPCIYLLLLLLLLAACCLKASMYCKHSSNLRQVSRMVTMLCEACKLCIKSSCSSTSLQEDLKTTSEYLLG